MRKRAVALVAAGVVLLGPAVGRAGGAALPGDVEGQAGDTHCRGEVLLNLNPGVSMFPSSGTFTSNGETGSITCDGPVNGFAPTGPGTQGAVGRYGVSEPINCSGGDAEFTLSFTIPTSGGPQQMTATGKATVGPLQGGALYGGTFSGDRMYGRFSVAPEGGDCFTTPVYKIRITGDEWIRAAG